MSTKVLQLLGTQHVETTQTGSQNVAEHKRFFDMLGEKLRHKSMNDWYNVTLKDIYKNGGDRILLHFDRSPSKALQTIYPEHHWDAQMFKQVRAGRHKAFFDRLGVQLGHKCMDDWYKVTLRDIQRLGGEGLISEYYKNSPSRALLNVYPQHNWMLWKSKQVPAGYWDKLINDQQEGTRIIKWLAEQMSFRSLDDWYRVSSQKVRKWINVRTSHQLVTMLQRAYPVHKWNSVQLQKIGKMSKCSQREVVLVMQQLFPQHGILWWIGC